MDFVKGGYLLDSGWHNLFRIKGFSIGEISIILRDRLLARSKIAFPIILEAVWGLIRLRLTGR